MNSYSSLFNNSSNKVNLSDDESNENNDLMASYTSFENAFEDNNTANNSYDNKRLKLDTNKRTISQSQQPMNGKKTKGRVKIKMEFIDNKLRRYTTFSKRKTGIMKKAYELSTLTGTQVMLLVASETGHVYTFATRKLQPMITSDAGKALIQTCLNSPDPHFNCGADSVTRMSATGFEETDLTYNTTTLSEDTHNQSPNNNILSSLHLETNNHNNKSEEEEDEDEDDDEEDDSAADELKNCSSYTQLENAIPVNYHLLTNNSTEVIKANNEAKMGTNKVPTNIGRHCISNSGVTNGTTAQTCFSTTLLSGNTPLSLYYDSRPQLLLTSNGTANAEQFVAIQSNITSQLQQQQQQKPLLKRELSKAKQRTKP